MILQLLCLGVKGYEAMILNRSSTGGLIATR